MIYNLDELYRKAFGYIAPPYPAIGTRAENFVPFIKKGGNKKPFDLQVAEDKRKSSIGLLGNPIRLPLRLNGVLMPNEPLIEMNGSKSIVVTELAGGNYSVKENMGMNDWSVSIKGIITNEENPEMYPEAKVREMLKLIRNEFSLKCENELLKIYDINYLVVKDFRFPVTEGAMGWQAYSLECLSDIDVELELFDPSNPF